ncbi:hypothetical protein FRC17_007635 [Serendipita sp. 399]|nr:hypothetical protein FRC17_007635 [Serendipita sp. 399]
MQTPVATKAEIQREMDSIRSMKRISSQTGPGSLPLDPDLPPQPGPGASGSPPSLSPTLGISGLNLQGNDGVLPQQVGEDEAIAGDAFFWVPASLHPELAPSEFKAFLRNHRRDVEEGGDDGAVGSAAGLGRMGSVGLRRSSSGLSRSSSSLSRKKSLLSRQYNPGEDDGDDRSTQGDEVRPMRRNRSVYSNAAPQLTIKDLQKLDDLADAAAAGKGGEASLIRSQLRRSMSLGLAGNIIDQIDAIQDDEENTPVIVPAKALQRTARTRIRKPGLEGDGNGHRFPSSRRGKRGKTMDPTMLHGDMQGYEDSSRPMSDLTTSDRGSLSDHDSEPYHRPNAPSPEALDADLDLANRPRFVGGSKIDDRPVSTGESIYDAYGSPDSGEIYYDARDSEHYEDDTPRVGAGGAVIPSRKGEEDDEEPFFTGATSKPVGYSTVETTAPTVILRPHSPEMAPEPLPLTSKSPPRDQRMAAAGADPTPVPYHGAAASAPSFIKEYGYHQYYGQTAAANQQSHVSAIHHPSPQRHLDVPPVPHSSVSPPSSPELIRSPSISPSAEVPYGRPFSAPPTTSDRPSSAEKKEKAEKDKKGRGLFGWGGSKDKDKEKEREKEKEKEKEREKEKEKKEKELLKKQKKDKGESKSSAKDEKESGGGLFGIFGGKKKHDGEGPAPQGNASSASQSGRFPGAKGQLMPFATAPPALAGQYARYPLHVERAVYRLSHIKLANPRRPLYEQVLISNLMFWYLGIINKPATPPEAKPAIQGGEAPTANQTTGPNSPVPAQPAVDANGQPIMSTAMSPAQQAAAAQAAAAEKTRLEREKREKEQQEREQREREMQETQERERREREQREKLEREKAEREREKAAKKTGLTKADREGRGRRAEMPVKTPNFDAQSRSMEQHYWEQDRERSSSGRPNTAPGSSTSTPVASQNHTAYHLPVRVQQRATPGPQQPYFYQQDLSQVVYQPINPYALPPGAKPPAHVENTWAVTSTAAAHANENKRGQSPPSQYYPPGTAPGSGAADRPRPSRSPPPQEYLTSSSQATGMPNGARPGRSLSATAINKPSGPTASGSFPPTNSSSPSFDYGRERQAAHQYSQSASPVVAPVNGATPSAAAASSSSGRLQKKKSTNNVTSPPNDGTKPPARRRKSMEVGAGDRRGMVEPDVSFESMWQQVQSQIHYGQPLGYDQPQQAQGQQGYTSYR